ncbi:MAG: [protein-PII] uridylyltransferase [Gammaproteobacteria bacterium]|jgi:[protein-PII] uridylyltransferase|tara:strand:- start:2312 stop:4984 length:2673 start_codon:yes stop_codon:yes gene_type:complete
MVLVSKELQHQLIDHDHLQQQLAALPSVQVLKATLQAGQSQLDDIFQEHKENRINELVHARAWLVDQILRMAWQQYSWPEEAALVAVGGYGRRELHPQSDVDLLILLGNGLNASSWHRCTQEFITFIWDLGLQIGSSVRTLEDCCEQAKNDITIATSLIESHTIIGKADLREQAFDWVISEQAWGNEAFYKARIESQQERHRRTNDTEYNLEPNIKNSPGGLRDIQTIGWIGKRHFGLSNMAQLAGHNYLNKSELDTLRKSTDYLWTIRYALHLIAKRPEERLLFDHQRKLATFFGYEDNEEELAVEQFMHRYYRTAMHLAELNQTLLQLFDQGILHAHEADLVVSINRRFELRNGRLQACYPSLFLRQPFAMMEAFVILAQHPQCQAIGAECKRLIQTYRHLIDDKYRRDIRVNSLFMELLRSPQRMSHTLLEMQRQGVLGDYLPAFNRIVGRMQHDMYHIYTVDAHCMKVVKKMRELLLPKERERFPVASRLVHQLPKIELLYIAGFFHDIGKGSGRDHSVVGAEEVRHFCKQHQLGKWDTELVSWLVRHHLLMSMTAQKRDISNPDIIHEFATKMGDQLHLDYLYVLTVSDINATNPALWNNWRASLLRQLYTATNRVLRLGLDVPVNHQGLIEQSQIDARKLLQAQRFNPASVMRLWKNLGDDYFIRENAKTIAWHTRTILNHQIEGPLVAISETSFSAFEGGTQIFVYTQDKANLFAVLCAILGQLNLDIQDARIITTEDGHSMDTFIVLDSHGNTINETPTLLAQLQERLTQALLYPNDFAYIVQQRQPRAHKLFNQPSSVSLTNPEGRSWTRLELFSADRPGLLAQVGLVFMRLGISLQKAKIQSIGGRVEDVFFITLNNGHRISDEGLLAKLENDICSSLDK